MKERIKTTVETLLQEKGYHEANVMLQDVTKNNGLVLTAVCIRTHAKENMAPSIYIDEYIEQLQNGSVDLNDVAEEIIELYEKHRIAFPFDPNYFFNRDYVLNHVVFKLVNKKKNILELENMPHRDFFDLSCIYLINVGNLFSEDTNGTIEIKNTMLPTLGVTEEELWDAANKNTWKLSGVDILSMFDLMGYGDDILYDTKKDYLWAVTNNNRHHGAAVMMYLEIFKNLADELGGDLFIIPCSIHELLVQKKQTENRVEEAMMLAGIVREVNHTAVEDDEFLSDSVYYFSRETGTIGLAYLRNDYE